MSQRRRRRRNSSWLFEGRNPLKGLGPEEQYEKVQWGNTPTKVTTIDVKHLRRKQDLVMLGRFAAMQVLLEDGSTIEIKARKPYPFLAFGASDNKLWLAGGSLDVMARNRDFGPPGNIGYITRIDYESDKGEKRGNVFYYYHDHHEPYAVLRVHSDGYPEYVGGGYTVRPEGIVH